MINNDYNNMICENGKFHIAFGIDQTHSASLTLPGRYAKIFAEMANSQDEYNNQNAFQFFGMEYFKLSERDREKFQAIIDIGFVDSLLNRIIDLAILVQKLEWFECIKNADNLMSQILKYACNNRHILYNPMTAVQKPNLRIATTINKNKQNRGALSDDIIKQITTRFPQGSYAFLPFSLCLMAGLRIGEAFGLSWQDISFENHCIFVTRQLQRRERDDTPSPREKALIDKYPFLSDTVWYVSNPKYESKRIIPLSTELEQILRIEKERQQKYRAILGNKYVKYYYTRENAPVCYSDFTSFAASKANPEYENGIVNTQGIGYEIDFVNRYEDGALVTESTLKHLSRIVQGKEKEPAICEFYNTHSLRHTFASRLRASGTEEHIVQALLGHKSTKETKTYLHITENEYLSVSLHMNNGTSKVDAVLSFIASQNLSEYQKNTLIDRLKNTV